MKTNMVWSTAALVLVIGAAAPANAQIRGDIGPLVGYYQPFGHFEPATVYSTSLPREPNDLRGVAWGAVGHLTFGRRLGMEGQLASASSTIPGIITPAGPRGPTTARVMIATLLGQYDVSPVPERMRLWLSAGPGLVQHGGSAYKSYGSPVSLGVAFGAGIALPIASELQVTAGATAVRYTLDVKMPPELQGNSGSLEHGTRTDAVIHLGLRWGQL